MDIPSKFDKLFAAVSRIQEELRQIAKKKQNCESSPGVEAETYDWAEELYEQGKEDGEIHLARIFFDKLEAITFPIETNTDESRID